MGLTMADVNLSSVPTALTNAAQLVIGVSLGVRFTRRFCMPRRAGWRPPHWARSVSYTHLTLPTSRLV